MPSQPAPKPSFSPYRKWGLGLQVGLVVVLVLAVVVMVNYLSQDLFTRLHLSTRTQNPLSPRTVRFLGSLTNQVKVVVYYDKDNGLFSTVTDLLNEYKTLNAKISVQVVDYLRDPGQAQKVKTDYKDKLGSGADKNLIIFDCDGRVKIVPGDALAQYTLEQLPNSEKEREFRRKPLAFEGEKAFTAALIAVTNLRPMNAYFLTGHNEHPFNSSDELNGYLEFSRVLEQNYVQVQPLSLAGTNGVPQDCNLLVIAGPTVPLLESELQNVEQYLEQGGRLLALLDSSSLRRPTGLEGLLAKWGVAVSTNIVVDPDHTASGSEVIVSAFSKHPLVNPLLGSGLYLIRPRAVSRLPLPGQPADAPQVEEIAFTGPRAFLYGVTPVQAQRLPLMVALEKGAVKGVVTERGTTRMVVVGDSLFLGNHQLELLANRDFAGCVVNWLLDRPQLIEGLGPRPVKEYHLVMTKTQLQSAQWILLAGMPGAMLLLGTLVWLGRRH